MLEGHHLVVFRVDDQERDAFLRELRGVLGGPYRSRAEVQEELGHEEDAGVEEGRQAAALR